MIGQPSRAVPLQANPLVATSSLDEFAQAIRPIFGVLNLGLTGGQKGFRATANFRKLEHSGLYYGHYDGRLNVSIPHASFIAQGLTIGGSVDYSSGSGSAILRKDELPFPVFERSRIKLDFSEGHRHLAFCMRPDAVLSKYNAMLGIGGDRLLNLNHAAPPPAAQLNRIPPPAAGPA
ncbi:hypothetical protein [Aestuariivirga sp.]|uniref:hypothetical protein n=1 Tax=Aestuariivirga sp. TaxID=2650926 RepID=UPI0039E2777A